jgi:hypothetical protein
MGAVTDLRVHTLFRHREGRAGRRDLPPRPAMRAVYAYHLCARHGLAPTRALLSS